MTRAQITYDPDVYDLARSFVSDVAGLTPFDIENCAHVLAQQIQYLIGDFVTGLETEIAAEEAREPHWRDTP
jgi:hypothetical protein